MAGREGRRKKGRNDGRMDGWMEGGREEVRKVKSTDLLSRGILVLLIFNMECIAAYKQ